MLFPWIVKFKGTWRERTIVLVTWCFSFFLGAYITWLDTGSLQRWKKSMWYKVQGRVEISQMIIGRGWINKELKAFGRQVCGFQPWSTNCLSLRPHQKYTHWSYVWSIISWKTSGGWEISHIKTHLFINSLLFISKSCTKACLGDDQLVWKWVLE